MIHNTSGKIYSLLDAELFIKELIRAMRQGKRLGSDEDVPEGSRYIMLSDTLARLIADRLDEVVVVLSYATVSDED